MLFFSSVNIVLRKKFHLGKPILKYDPDNTLCYLSLSLLWSNFGYLKIIPILPSVVKKGRAIMWKEALPQSQHQCRLLFPLWDIKLQGRDHCIKPRSLQWGWEGGGDGAEGRFLRHFPDYKRIILEVGHLVWFYSKSNTQRYLSSLAFPFRPVLLFFIDGSVELLYLINNNSIFNLSYLKSQRSWGLGEA